MIEACIVSLGIVLHNYISRREFLRIVCTNTSVILVKLYIVRQVVSSSSKPLSSSTFHKCPSCLIGKTSRLHLSSTFSKCNHPLDLIHSDVWGPSPIVSFYGHKYFVIFIDNYLRYVWLLIFLIQHKTDVVQVFVNFQKLVERQFCNQNKGLPIRLWWRILNFGFTNSSNRDLTSLFLSPYTWT